MKTSVCMIAAFVSQVLALPATETTEKRAPAPDHARATAVRQAFQTAWDGYYAHAFPHDSLLPITNTYEDDRLGGERFHFKDGWLLTLL